MSIHPRYVKFSHPGNGYAHDRDVAAAHLTVGETYTVERAEVEAWSTAYLLKEVPGVRFNSVLFTSAPSPTTEEEGGENGGV